MTSQLKGEVIPINQLEVPETLYKYRCFNNSYHEKALYENELFLPSANLFNDPYDSKIPFRYNKDDLTEDNIFLKCLDIAKQISPSRSDQYYHEEAFRMQREDLLNNSYHLEQVDKLSFNRLCNDYGIYCLTPDSENLLMWSYYADSHKGFCIGYSSKYLVQCGLFGMGGEIAYRDDFPRLPLFITEDDRPMLNLLFSKWKVWKHENEYRLIHRYKNGNTFNLDKTAITEVVLGCQLTDEQKISQVLKINENLPNVKIYQIEQNKETFGLKKIAISDDKFIINSK